MSVEGVVRRNRNADNSRFDTSYIDYITYALESEYQYITLSNDNESGIHGVIIPKFTARNGSHKFRFAIDSVQQIRILNIVLMVQLLLILLILQRRICRFKSCTSQMTI